ncbi:MAG: FecR domain-containing protein [Gemmatimonadales bacterium]
MSEIEMELLERYLAGEVSTDEGRRVEAWLAEDPRRWQELKAVREALEQKELSDGAVQEAVAEVWARLAPRIGGGDLPPLDMARTVRRPSHAFALPEARRNRRIFQLAALLALMVGGSLVARLVIRRPEAHLGHMQVAATTRGERATFRLPDGTRVMLGVASKLRYPKEFTGSRRDVSLEGEAYFEVAHREAQPFVLRVGSMLARDLGTQFTARAYPDDREARVVVREGKVAVRAAGAPAPERVVSPGQLGRVTRGEVAVEAVDTAAQFAWIDGRLVLDEMPLHEALPQLSRWFDLEFRLADSASRGILLTTTLKTQPTAEVLDNLSASLGLRYRKRGRTVTLYPPDQLP